LVRPVASVVGQPPLRRPPGILVELAELRRLEKSPLDQDSEASGRRIFVDIGPFGGCANAEGKKTVVGAVVEPQHFHIDAPRLRREGAPRRAIHHPVVKLGEVACAL
jgi:hypothetical protein